MIINILEMCQEPHRSQKSSLGFVAIMRSLKGSRTVSTRTGGWGNISSKGSKIPDTAYALPLPESGRKIECFLKCLQ